MYKIQQNPVIYFQQRRLLGKFISLPADIQIRHLQLDSFARKFGPKASGARKLSHLRTYKLCRFSHARTENQDYHAKLIQSQLVAVSQNAGELYVHNLPAKSRSDRQIQCAAQRRGRAADSRNNTHTSH
jgi:hypothetical protein